MPANFSSLPAELKANVLEHVARQENNWKRRLGFLDEESEREKEKSLHVDALVAASLVSREWWSLAAPSICYNLYSQSTKHPLVRLHILHTHGHRFKFAQLSCPEDSVEEEGEVDFDSPAYKDMTSALDYTLSILPLLPNLRSLSFTDEAASHLWGRDDFNINSKLDDERGLRSKVLGVIAQRIVNLVSNCFRPFEAHTVLRVWPKAGLRRLALDSLTLLGSDEDGENGDTDLDLVCEAITSMSSLVDLRISYDDNRPELGTTWSPTALSTLRANPPPITKLMLECSHLRQSDLDFISTFSPTLKHLGLNFHDFQGHPSFKPTIELPLLVTLDITVSKDDEDEFPQKPLSTVLPAFFSCPLISLVIADDSTKTNLDGSCPLTIIDNNFPNLRVLDVTTVGAKELSLVAAFCAERDLPAPVDTPFDYSDFIESITDKENGLVCDGLDGVLDWGKLEVGRLRGGAKVRDSVALLEALRPLDALRNRWMD